MGTSQTHVNRAHRPPADRIVLAIEERRGIVLDAIRAARARITLSLFRCTDQEVLSELKAAVDRGVAVEVLVTSRAGGGKRRLRRLWKELEATGAAVHAYTDPVVKYHAKYVVVDDGPALIASLNFTRKCFERTCDAIVVTYDPEVVAGLRELMAADCDRCPLPDMVTGRLIVGPERARRQLTALLASATERIQVIDPKASDPQLLALLAAKRAEGVAVDLYGSKTLNGMKSHGKIMLIDGKTAVVGSLALTVRSLDNRREVAVLVTDPDAVAAVAGFFSSLRAPDLAAAAPAALPGEAPC